MSRAPIAIGLLAVAYIVPIWSLNPVRAQDELPPVVSRRSSPAAAYPRTIPQARPRTPATPLTANPSNGLYLRLADQASAEELPLSAPTTAADEPTTDSTGSSAARQSASQSRARRPAFDPQAVARGQSAFEDSCTQCHDADRALQKRKSLSGWLTTVRRMARMDGADIDSANIVPIATYLASLSAPAGDAAATGDGAEDDGDAQQTADGQVEQPLDELTDLGPGLSFSGTIAPLWRGGNDNLENPGFFPDVWLRADWQPSGPLRGRVTTCTSCHSDQTNDGGFTFEVVEATAHYDLLHHLKEGRPEHCQPRISAEIKAGRFVVPFGAYAALSHPGIYRTVTNPLIYNMGRQVLPDRSRPPVLPMPYSDEGADLFAKVPLLGDVDATLDVYAVNGLQGGGPGVQFTRSRSYVDNNSEPAVGGRATVGNGTFRFGGSVMTGRMEDDMAPVLNYRLAGGDVTARLCDDRIRLYFEYAMRRNDTSFPDQQIAYGTVSEMELLLWSEPNISALARYDNLEHRDFFGDQSVRRFTWGLSTTVLGGSLLMINLEHWDFSFQEEAVDVVGLRWVATF